MKVEIDVPDKIVIFLKDVTKLSDLDLEDYLREAVVRGFTADLDTVGDCAFFNAEGLKAKYGLEEVDEK